MVSFATNSIKIVFSNAFQITVNYERAGDVGFLFI